MDAIAAQCRVVVYIVIVAGSLALDFGVYKLIRGVSLSGGFSFPSFSSARDHTINSTTAADASRDRSLESLDAASIAGAVRYTSSQLRATEEGKIIGFRAAGTAKVIHWLGNVDNTDTIAVAPAIVDVQSYRGSDGDSPRRRGGFFDGWMNAD